MSVSPVPEKMRLEMIIRMQIKILDSQGSCLFSNEPCDKKPVMTIEDFNFHFDDHFSNLILSGTGCIAMAWAVCSPYLPALSRRERDFREEKGSTCCCPWQVASVHVGLDAQWFQVVQFTFRPLIEDRRDIKGDRIEGAETNNWAGWRSG